MKPKPVISSEHAINWYVGNYLMNPNNALRDNDELMDSAHKEMEELRIRLKGKTMTHREFLDVMKLSGIHKKYYHYQKPKPADCEICRMLGIR